MNPLAFVSGLLAVTCFLLALFILKFARDRVHRLWACFNVSVGIWGIGICLASLSKSQESAFRFWQFAHAGGFFISVFFYHVVHDFCELKGKIFLLFVCRSSPRRYSVLACYRVPHKIAPNGNGSNRYCPVICLTRQMPN